MWVEDRHGMCAATIGITADDLTGAADTAAALARPGAPVMVSTDMEPRAPKGSRAFAVTTSSRACSPDEVYTRVRTSLEALRGAGASLIYKKVDSNLRGNIGAEMAGVRDTIRGPVLLAPAFPARGRTTVEGVMLIHGVPVAETEMASDPEAPVQQSDVIELVRSQWRGLSVSHCPLGAVRAGPKAIRDRIGEQDVLVLDAEIDKDLDAIARAALSLSPAPALVGSAGLAAAVGRRVLGRPTPQQWGEETGGPLLAIVASSSQALLAQVRFAAAERDFVPVAFPCEHLSYEDQRVPELEEAIAHINEELASGRSAVVYATGPLPAVEDPVALVVEHLAHLAFVLVKRTNPQGLLVGGGATAQGVLTALGAEAIAIDDEPLSGVGAGVVGSGDFAGRPVVLKPGAAGGDNAILRLLEYLGHRVAALRSKA